MTELKCPKCKKTFWFVGTKNKTICPWCGKKNIPTGVKTGESRP